MVGYFLPATFSCLGAGIEKQSHIEQKFWFYQTNTTDKEKPKQLVCNKNKNKNKTVSQMEKNSSNIMYNFTQQ